MQIKLLLKFDLCSSLRIQTASMIWSPCNQFSLISWGISENFSMKHIHHFYDLTQIILKHKDTWVYIPVQYHIDFTEDFTSDVNEPGAFTTRVK